MVFVIYNFLSWLAEIKNSSGKALILLFERSLARKIKEMNKRNERFPSYKNTILIATELCLERQKSKFIKIIVFLIQLYGLFAGKLIWVTNWNDSSSFSDYPGLILKQCVILKWSAVPGLYILTRTSNCLMALA